MCIRDRFSTEIKLDWENIETVNETKLLGTTITNDLDWKKNTDRIVKEANKRMVFLHKLSRFTNNKQDLKKVYILQIRSKGPNTIWNFAVYWNLYILEWRDCHYRDQRPPKPIERMIKVCLIKIAIALRVIISLLSQWWKYGSYCDPSRWQTSNECSWLQT